jgi:hypothetical protein
LRPFGQVWVTYAKTSYFSAKSLYSTPCDYVSNDGHDGNDGICFLDSPEIFLGARRE